MCELEESGKVRVKLSGQQGVIFSSIAGRDDVVTECMDGVDPLHAEKDRTGVGNIDGCEAILRTGDPAVRSAVEEMHRRERRLETGVQVLDAERHRL